MCIQFNLNVSNIRLFQFPELFPWALGFALRIYFHLLWICLTSVFLVPWFSELFFFGPFEWIASILLYPQVLWRILENKDISVSLLNITIYNASFNLLNIYFQLVNVTVRGTSIPFPSISFHFFPFHYINEKYKVSM